MAKALSFKLCAHPSLAGVPLIYTQCVCALREHILVGPIPPTHTDGGNKDVCIFDRRQNAVRWKRRRGIPYDAQHHEKGCCELRDVYKLV